MRPRIGLLCAVLLAASCAHQEVAVRTTSTTLPAPAPDSGTRSAPNDQPAADGATDIGDTPVDPPPITSIDATEDRSTAGPVDPTTTSEGSARPPSSTTTKPRLAGSYGVEVIATHPHDADAYTQGLELREGRLLESTGIRGSSTRRWVDPVTGEIQLQESLDETLFGEGITVAGDKIYQLTLTAGLVLVSGLDDLTLQSTLTYEGEGWGLCHDGTHLVMSDGSDVLTLRRPDTFEVERSIPVRLNGQPVDLLNELECVGDQILANIWGLDQIIAVDAASGRVDAVIDANGLRPETAPASDLDYALNGIAYSASTDTYYATGKLWPVLYEIRLVLR